MNMRSRRIPALMLALCLAWAVGAAGTAFADDGQPALATGTIAADDPSATDSEPAPDPEPAHADGWDKTGSSWTYWKNGEQVKGRWVVTSKAPGMKGIPEGKHRYWIAKDGKLAVGRVIDPSKAKDEDAGYCAYATNRGYVATKGKRVVGDKVYLVKNDKGKLASGNAQGFLSTGVFDDGEVHRYYINPSTHAATTGKPVKVKGFGWVYAYPKKGYLLTGTQKVDKTHIVLAGKDGKLWNRSGWLTTAKYSDSGKQRYYLERTKKYKNLYGARIGSFKVSGQRYLGQPDGSLFRSGYQLVNGNYYHADGKGALTYDGVVTRMYKKAQGYSSPSRYLLMVDIDDPKTIVFEGSQSHWKPKFIWDCCTGAPETPTVVGTYSVGIKGSSFGEDRGFSCYYYTQISGDYLFHTRLYYANTRTLMDKDNLGNRHSHGCVHLLDENAKWIWDNVPSGTTIACIR